MDRAATDPTRSLSNTQREQRDQRPQRSRFRTIALMNQKGGSGKTTTAVNLAAALAEHGKRVLVLDLDPQASASAWFGVMDGGRELYDLLTGSNGTNGNLADLARPTRVPGVDLIPSSAWLVGLERALASEIGSELLVRRHVERLPAAWSFLLVDCPPTLGLLAVSALVACDEVLVPVEAHVMALAGLAALMQTVERVRERLNPALAITGVLPCRYDARTNHSREVVERLRERFGRCVLRSPIRENVRLAEAPSFAQPITVYAPTSAGAEDYRAVAAELLELEHADTHQEAPA